MTRRSGAACRHDAGAMRKRQTDARKALRPLLPDDLDWLARNPFRP
jgi:hypothetical protein